jgi:hypothetical protein
MQVDVSYFGLVSLARQDQRCISAFKKFALQNGRK